MLFQQAIFPAELEIKPLRELAFEFFQCYNFQMMAFKNFKEKIEHFTDLVRLFHVGECKWLPNRSLGGASERLPDRSFGGAKLSCSATQLHEARVKFKVARGNTNRRLTSILDIDFNLNNGVLEITCITLSDERIRVIRNIIALEKSLYVGHAYVTDYYVVRF